MGFDRATLILPDGTDVQEHTIVLPRGDAVIADGATIDFGVECPGKVFIGERAELGFVRAKGDVRIDLWTRVRGDVASDGNVYLGERVHVEGKLSVANDLDVGDDVKIEKGFEARGWINIRNPVPMVMYVFIYLLQLMGQGRSDEVDRILKELEKTEDAEALVVDDVYLFVPKGARLGLAETIVVGPFVAGAACRLVGNHRIGGNATLGARTTLHGALVAGGNASIGEKAEVMGDVTAAGIVRLGDGVRVRGSIRGQSVEMATTAVVDGTVHAERGVRFLTTEAVTAKEKVEDFEAGHGDLGQVL